MKDLPLEVRSIDHVIIDQPDPPDAGGGEIKRGRRAETAGADQEDRALPEPQLSRLAHARDAQMASVAFAL